VPQVGKGLNTPIDIGRNTVHKLLLPQYLGPGKRDQASFVKEEEKFKGASGLEKPRKKEEKCG